MSATPVADPVAVAVDAGTCPVCGHATLDGFLRIPAVPVLSTEFHDDREAARHVTRGDLDLAVCRHCSLVWNTAFDPALVDYTPDYENSQHFSPSFVSYVEDLARRLDADHGLRGGTVVDVGCGKAEFLAVLAATADAHGIGFDPTFDGEVEHDRVRVVRELYDRETAAEIDADLVMARHVVEHLADPVTFLRDVRVASGAGTAFYYEVPNADHVFSDEGMWDLIYQHVCYFGVPSLDLALRVSGHDVVRLDEAFHGQFLGIDAVAADAAPSIVPDAGHVAAAVARVETFADRHRARVAHWDDVLAATDGEVALWGAGAKGVAFLNLLADASAVDHVIDLNPRKAGRFVPGTGHRVDRPVALTDRAVTDVLVMNPAYEAEIRHDLEQLGVDADLHIV